MLPLIVRRVGEGVLALLGVAAAVFFLLHLDPASPAAAMLGLRFATPARIAALNRALGLDRPVPVQFVLWLNVLLLHGGLQHTVATTAPATLALIGLGGTGGLVAAVATAVLQTRFRGSWVDRGLSGVTYLLNAMPAFWVANALLFLFAIVLLWLPASGTLSYNQSGFGQWLLHMLLPAGCLGLSVMGGWARYLRASLDEAMTSDYVRTARSLGAGEGRVIRRHALRNALLPLVTMVGLSMPTMLNAVIVIEVIFAINGLGQAFWGSVSALSFGSAAALALVLAAVTVGGNLAADVSYALLDPRIRYD